jgi:hypothetical protein
LKMQQRRVKVWSWGELGVQLCNFRVQHWDRLVG